MKSYHIWKDAAGDAEFARFLPSLLSGTALFLAFPTFGLYPLAWVALVPFLISVYGMGRKDAFTAGVLFGIPYFGGTQYWIYHSIYHYGGVNLVLSILIVGLLTLYMSLFTGIFGMMYSMKVRSSRIPATLLAPLFWVTLEYLRGWLFTGFPWSSIGYSQYEFLHIIQIADIAGVYGVSFLILAVNGAITDISITKRRREDMPLTSLVPWASAYILLGIALLFSLGYGIYRLSEDRPGKDITVSVVQGNIPQDQKWLPEFQEKTMHTYFRLSIEADMRDPDLIVWPETALPFVLEYDAGLTRKFHQFAQSLGRPLLFGVTTMNRSDGGEITLGNSAILLNEKGFQTYRYDKTHLVPFGEYIPLQPVLGFLDKVVVGIGDFRPGAQFKRGGGQFGSFGTAICYEIIFPGLVREFFRKKGGDFLVTITNDAWFGNTTGPYQHWSMAAFRAIENRKPVIRAANTGISGFMDSSGRIIASTKLFERTALTRTVRTDSTQSAYTRYGDLLAYVCMVFTLFLLMNIKLQ